MMKDVQKLSPDLFQQANQNNVDNEVIARPLNVLARCKKTFIPT